MRNPILQIWVILSMASLFGCGSTPAPDPRPQVKPPSPSRIAADETKPPMSPPGPPADMNDLPGETNHGEEIWARRFGGPGMEMSSAVVVDANDNIFVAGNFTGTLDLGNGEPVDALGLEDIFLAKMDPRGQVIWVRVVGGPGHDYAGDLAVDDNGDVYLTGAFTRETRIGQKAVKCKGVHDVFVVKIAGDGEIGWSRVLGDQHDQISLRVEAASDGGVYLAGWFRGNVRPARRRHSSYPDKATFVARLDPTGRGIWSDSFGHIFDYADPDLARDGTGGVIMTGGSDPTMEFTGKKMKRVDRMAELGLVVARYDEDGELTWRRRYGDGGDNMITRAATLPGGDIVVAGSYGGVLDFGSTKMSATGLSDVFVARLDREGRHIWSRTATGARYQSLAALAVAPDSTIYVAGQFEGGSIDFGGEILDGSGYIDVYLAAFSGEGRPLWSRAYGDDKIQWPSDMALDSRGNPVITGAFSGEIEFGKDELSSAGGHDVFVAKLRK